MKLPDPVAPYASLIKWILITVILVGLPLGGFLKGCSHGEARQQTKVDKAKAELATEKQRADGLAETLNTINERTKKQVEAAERRKLNAEKQAAEAQAETEKAKDQVASLQVKLERSKRNPTCKSQLELELCDDIPLY